MSFFLADTLNIDYSEYMKRLLFMVGIFCVVAPLFAQDVELFHRYQDDKLVMPVLPSGMTFDEFQILDRNIRLMDMAAGVAFPGYISFKAKEETAAYIAIGIRAVGYAGVLYELYQYNDIGSARMFNDQTDRNIGYITAGMLISSFLFDWIYGKTSLEEKQEAIRFKYRQTLSALAEKPEK